MRNPQGIRAVISITLFQGLLASSVFHEIGTHKLLDYEKLKNVPIWKRKSEFDRYVEWNQKIMKDYDGFVFFCATD